ncbi:hypothetical protein HY492_01335 [Candidatus Woesearchaeota archaeon]|nr:hypothetical protein [Candidatus Woesearchaeota archaeon]
MGITMGADTPRTHAAIKVNPLLRAVAKSVATKRSLEFVRLENHAHTSRLQGRFYQFDLKCDENPSLLYVDKTLQAQVQLDERDKLCFDVHIDLPYLNAEIARMVQRDGPLERKILTELRGTEAHGAEVHNVTQKELVHYFLNVTRF